MAKILKNQGSHRILSIMTGLDGENPLQLIELAGRTSYQSRDRITDESAVKFVEMIRKLGHESVIEHSAMMVEFNNVSRGLTHELVRHRLASYLQESTRYVDESDFLVVIPPDKNPDEKLVELNIPGGQKAKVSFSDWVELNEQMYRGLRSAGWIPQDARQILPTGIKAQIVVTANFREWRHIFKLRCAPNAHWEIREAMLNLLKDVAKRIPVVFDDFQINEKDKTARLIS
jgi:thymidylate synthase (FAD)